MKKEQGMTLLECILYIGLSTIAFFMLTVFVTSLTVSLKKMMHQAQEYSSQYSALERLHASLRKSSPEIHAWHALSQDCITWQDGDTVVSWYQQGTRFMYSYKKGTTGTQYRVIAENISTVLFDYERNTTHVVSIACILKSSSCMCKRKYVYSIGLL